MMLAHQHDDQTFAQVEMTDLQFLLSMLSRD